jgi:hypothetical protein
MFAASTKAGGVCQVFPDVCKVPAPPAPPVPTPFPNLAQCAMALPPTCTMVVKIGGMPALHKGSEIPLSSGDEAGVAGGVVSGVNMQKCVYRTWSSKVYVEGNQIVTHTKVTAHNGANPNAPPGSQISPSQAVVFVTG